MHLKGCHCSDEQGEVSIHGSLQRDLRCVSLWVLVTGPLPEIQALTSIA